MTVKELIEELSKLEQNALVFRLDDSWEMVEVIDASPADDRYDEEFRRGNRSSENAVVIS